MNTVDKVVIIVYSRNGMQLAEQTAAFFVRSQVKMVTAHRLAKGLFRPEAESGEDSVGGLFDWADAIIFICALGIAVRKIAPYVKDKKKDPAVVCMDEQGKFVISVLSGHIGGANQLAEKLADYFGSIPVITTATDRNGRFSVDEWAVRKGLTISDMKAAKAISAAILEQDVILESDFPIVSDYPTGCRPLEKDRMAARNTLEPDESLPGGNIVGDERMQDEKLPEYEEVTDEARHRPGCGIIISWETREPFAVTLRLIPQVLHLGIGCRKDISKEKIAEAVRGALSKKRIDPRAVKGVYSIDLKAQEAGLLEYCREMDWPLHVYSAQELMQVPGEFSSSDFVLKTTGADNICERAAMADAARLILPKISRDGVTVAIAEEAYEVAF